MSVDVTLKKHSLNNYNLRHFVTKTWQWHSWRNKFKSSMKWRQHVN